MLAVIALQQHGVSPDQGEVLVTGAAGGVGSVATTILSNLGYQVAASTGRAETHDYLRSLGAATIIPARGRLRYVRWAVFALLGLLYLVMASTEGWAAALMLAYFIGVKLGPFVATPPNLRVGATVGLRWGFQVALFLSAVVSFGGMESLLAGAVYWTAICVAEWTGLTEAELFHEEIPETA